VSTCRDRTWDHTVQQTFCDITEVPISRDLWPRPWPWAHPGCRPGWEPSCASLVVFQPFACEKKRFSWNHKSVPITWPLTLTLSTSWMRALLWTIMCKFGRDPAIFLVEEAICAKCLQTDRRKDGRQMPHDCISSRNELKITCYKYMQQSVLFKSYIIPL